MKINIKKLNDNAIIPTYGSAKAAAMDLYADVNEPITIEPHKTAKIGIGFAVQPPENWCALILARSGLANKHGLAPSNKVGLCDEDYRGEYIVSLHNHSDEAAVVNHGDRIAQLMFVPYTQATLNLVDELDDTERGAGGFGSTGK